MHRVARLSATGSGPGTPRTAAASWLFFTALLGPTFVGYGFASVCAAPSLRRFSLVPRSCVFTALLGPAFVGYGLRRFVRLRPSAAFRSSLALVFSPLCLGWRSSDMVCVGLCGSVPPPLFARPSLLCFHRSAWAGVRGIWFASVCAAVTGRGFARLWLLFRRRRSARRGSDAPMTTAGVPTPSLALRRRPCHARG